MKGKVLIVTGSSGIAAAARLAAGRGARLVLATADEDSGWAIARILQQDSGERGVRGAIVNLGSVLARSPEPRHFAAHASAAAKGAIAGMTRSMASYYAPHGIRLNLPAPGVVRTAASERAGAPELLDFLRRKQPLAGGMVDAGDVARPALFLLSEDALSITGEAIAVDGGWSVSGA